ncbi:ABC transporter ATP-binding protein [Cryomorpha ignava]|uniref:ABC transporter ATP-binding protein n=1 Tax=Cryomorpha ignava TaxID=101383 RepID=A0A7K3WM12_9FLAO|nr:ABC transporter ATP-binding protein [Cryomorpha ignava]NEN22680.1 ABC transporter ATP-binding protein [Cryomorpha ignava]
MRALAHLNKYLWHYKWQIILGTVFIIASNLFAIYAPRMIREAFDLITESLDTYNTGNVSDFALKLPYSVSFIFDLFNISTTRFTDINSVSGLTKAITSLSILLAILYLVASLFKGIFLFFTRQTIIIMSRLIEFDLKNEIFDQYQRLNLAFYRRNKTGDLMNRISEDVSQVRMYLGPAIMYTLNLVVLSVLAIWAMLSVNVELTLYVLLPLPVLSVSIYYVSTLINKRSEKVQRQQSHLSTLVQEAFSGIRVLKAFNRQKSTQENFAKECNTYKVDSLRLVKVDALFMPAIILLIGMSTIITIYVGGLKAINGEITIGNIAEFVIYVNMLTWPFASVGWVTSLVQRAAASQKRINEFLHIEPEIRNPKEAADEIKGKIAFEDVSFVYPDSGIKALRNVSFEINSGETLAIIGRTGSGKSTIANLICRNFDVTSGRLLIDNEPIEKINLNSLRSNIGYVPQDVFLFSDTIANNIAFGLSSDENVRQMVEMAAENAYVKHNIEEFPKKFETMLGERGINLSGGQKQRVSIARAIAGKPQILIFDDCLSAVDTETEEIILSNLKKIMVNKTTVLISHRVSTVKMADKILVLDEGAIIESGTHDELLSKKGTYAELHLKQLSEERKVEQD